MKPLYIIRRENIRFIGPMTVKEFSEALVRMEFGTQDEVCGNCGSWITLDDRSKLKIAYPEIEKILSEHKSKSWKQESGLHSLKTRKIETMEKRPLKRRSHEYSDVVPAKGRPLFPIAIFLSALILLGASVYFANESGFFSRFKPDTLTPQIQELNALMMKDNPEEFLRVFEEKLPLLNERVLKSKELFNSTLPMYRMFAFYTTGEVANYPSRNLKGTINIGFDCTLNMFVKKWDEFNGGPYSFSSGNFIPKNPWSKILSWDPYWIKRRPAKGWLKPHSYFEGCLIVALNAAAQLEKQSATPYLKAVEDRIIEQQKLLNISLNSELPAEPQNVWQVFSCMDQAGTIADINKCKISKVAEGEFKRLVEEYSVLQTARIYILSRQNIKDEAGLKDLRLIIDKLGAESGGGRPDYEVERKFLTALLNAGGKYDQINFDSGDVRLRP